MFGHYFKIFILLTFLSKINAQVIEKPFVNIKSHPTLGIDKIERSKTSTVFYLSLKNELDNGYFCVDNNVFISIPGKRIKFNMIKSEGIENCPEMHKFSSKGQVINFKLFFPPISDTIMELDLVENCTDNCFYIRGINLDIDFNNEINNFDIGVNYYRNGVISHALPYFLDIVNKSKYKKSKHYAYSLFIIPIIYEKNGYIDDASKAFTNLLNSDIVEKEYFIRKIKEIPFFTDK
jgi:hypothetical protein